MGLDISTRGHSFRAGSYTQFDAFRNTLAQHAGYINQVEWWHENKNKVGQWKDRSGTYDTANKVKHGILLAHSDADGFIYKKWNKQLLKELKEVEDDIKSGEFTPENPDFHRLLRCWIQVTEKAISSNDNIEFS